MSDYPQANLALILNRLPVAKVFVIGCLTMPRLPVAKPLTIAALDHESTPSNRARLTGYWVVSDYPQTGLRLDHESLGSG